MSQPPSNKAYNQKGAWIWWVIFPPYAMYRFMRYSTMKWFIKVPVLLVLTLAIVMAVDLAVSPHRVEIAIAEKAIDSYVKEELEGETMVLTERMGEGTSVKSEAIQLTVYYRVVTENSLYHMGLVSDDGSKLVVQHVEQLFPIRQDIKGFESRSKADVAIWLKENEAEVGVPLKLTKDEASKNMQTILTANGEYNFHYTNTHLYEVQATGEDKALYKTEETPPLPKEIKKYLKKNKDRIGVLTRVLAYELNGGVERYHVLTSEGNFRFDMHPDGSVAIDKRSE